MNMKLHDEKFGLRLGRTLQMLMIVMNPLLLNSIAKKYADEALKVFDRLFPEPAQNDNDVLRRDLWSDAFAMTANANNCKKISSAVFYANAALDHFDKTFPKLEQKISLEKQ